MHPNKDFTDVVDKNYTVSLWIPGDYQVALIFDFNPLSSEQHSIMSNSKYPENLHVHGCGSLSACILTLLRSGHLQGKPPAPTVDEVKICRIPKQRGYAREFPGFATQGKALEEGLRLRDALLKDKVGPDTYQL